MADLQQSLSVLQRLRALSNVGSDTQGQLDANRPLTTEDLMPTDSELQDQQIADANKQEAQTGYSYTTPLNEVRADAMSKLRAKLLGGQMQSQSDVAKAQAGPAATAAGEVEKAKIAAQANADLNAANAEKARAEAGHANEGTKLQESMLNGGGAGAGGGVGGNWKTSINANGEPSFTQTVQPAMIQKSIQSLGDAQAKTQNALLQLENLYPGILKAAQSVDSSKESPGWVDTLLGNTPKYGSAKDLLLAKNERAKYNQGLPTPYADMIQNTSFGNIEQMAGQLPGTRAFTSVLPLMKEHQARFGQETPLATAQRLIHMNQIMGQSLDRWQHGDVSDFNPLAAQGQ